MVVEDSDPLPNRYARIDTDVNPETAEVYLDGTYIGSADDFDGWPDYLYLEPGKYRLEFRHPDYETLVKELEVRRGQKIDFTDEMKLLPGKTRLGAKDPERRGTPLGRVFGQPDTERKERGDRTGRWDARGGEPRRPVDMDDPDEIEEPDEDVPPPAPAPRPEARKARPAVEDVAPAERGRFRFDVRPVDAAVWLDDKYVGTAEELGGLRRGLAVTPGKHSVTVVRPGYGTKTIDVEAKPGAAIDVVVELEK